MKKKILKLACLGLITGLCLSAQSAEDVNNEIAMSKCTRDDSNRDGKGQNSCSCGGKNGGCNGQSDSSCSSNSGNDQSDASTSLKGKRKSAAQKVLHGE